MRGRFSLVFTLGLVLGSQLFGAVPQFTAVPPAVVDVRLQDSSVFTVQATDPDNHQLSYSWQIVSDPTGVVYNSSGGTSPTAVFAFPWLNEGVGPQPMGSLVRLRITVAHANPAWDGQASTSYEFNARISSLNQPPVPRITGFFGTPETPLRPGDAIVANAEESTDPDSGGFVVSWMISIPRGGFFVQQPVLFGSEGTLMSITVPDIVGTGLVELDVTLTLLDGLHSMRATKTAYLRNSGSSIVNTTPRLTFPETVTVLPNQQIQITGTVEDLDGDDCEFTWTFLQGSASAMQPIVTVISTSPTRKWQVTCFHSPLPVGSYQFRLTAREKNTADHKTSSATITVLVTNGTNPPQTGPPEYSTTESGCDNNTAPTLSFSPNVQTAKPIYTSGTPVTIAFSATDSSSIPSPINPNLVSTGTVVEWTDLSQLTALGVNPQTTPSTKDPNMNQRSFSNLTFTAPNHTGTIYLKAKATDVFGCSKTATFGIGFQATGANTPPIARIRYQIDGGLITTPSGAAVLVLTNFPHTIALDGTTSTDAEGAIAQYSWSLTGGSGLTLTGSTSASAGFTVPAGFSGSVIVSLTVRDSLSAQNTASVAFNFQAASATAPTARIRYKIGANGTFTEASGPVTINAAGSSQSVIFDGSTSTNALTYAWTKESTLTAGSVTAIGSATSTTYNLAVSGSARGTVVVRLTAKNGALEEGTASITLNIQGPADQPPVARIKYKIDSGALTAAPASGSIAITNGTTKVITLDGTNSTDPEGMIASYQWVKTTSVIGSVSLTGSTSSTAVLTINAGTEGPITVSLTVKDSANQSNTAQIFFIVMPANADPTSTYFAQVGVGPMPGGQEELRTVLLLLNTTSRTASGVTLEMTDSAGQPLQTIIDGQPYEGEPFDMPPLSSKRLAISGTMLQVGWVRVRSEVSLTGLAQFQIAEIDSGEIRREVSIFSSPPARKYATFYDPTEEFALAVANPTSQPARVNVKLVDYVNGEQSIVQDRALFPELPGSRLEPGRQMAKFIDTHLWGQLPANFRQGTLIVESDVEVVVSFLKTKDSMVFSALPGSDPTREPGSLPDAYFPQIAVGPLEDGDEFRSVLLLVNPTNQTASGISIDFFNSAGGVLEAEINGAPWDNQPFDLLPLSSRRLVFTGSALQVGWAHLRSSVELTTLVQFQVVNGESLEVKREVGIFSSAPGRRFATFFDAGEETALAVANPTDQPAQVRVKLYDCSGAEPWMVTNQPLFPENAEGRLNAKEHGAKFMDSTLLGQLPSGFKGTLVVESDTDVIVAVLKTKGGLIFSALPLALVR